MVDAYMQPLFLVDDLLTPSIEVDPSSPDFDDEVVMVGSHKPWFLKVPLHRKILFRYYDLWDPFLRFEFELMHQPFPEPDPFYHFP